MFKKNGSQLRSAPDIPALQQLLNRCFSQPGEKLQVYWRTTENQLFILDLVYVLKDRVPHWQLISEKSGRRLLISDYIGHDILLVYKQLTTAINQAMENRAGEDSSRISRTRDARAAATNWLETKTDEPIEKAPPRAAGADFWQDGDHEISTGSSTLSAVAAAIDESPWSNQSTAPVEMTGSFGHQAPANAWAKSTTSDWSQYDPSAVEQSKSQAGPSKANDPSAQSTSQAPRAKSQSPQPSHKAAVPNKNETPSPQPTKPAARVRPDAAEKAGSDTARAKAQQSDKISAQPVNKQQPPAPVKVTSAGPQVTAPNPLMNNLAPRYQNAPAPSGKDRSMAFLDKGNQGSDKKSDSDTTGQSSQQQRAAEPERSKAAPNRISEHPEMLQAALPTGGDLTDTTVPKLLKQFKSAQISARLDFSDDDVSAIVYLDEGKPVEAWMGELKGDAALLELLLWTTGSYTVNIGMSATNRNVKSTPEQLVQHNTNIASLLDELAGEGLTATSTFAQSNPLLSSQEFDRLASPEAPMELEKLAKLYVKLDGKKTLADLHSLRVLPRPILVQAIHHLYFNNVIDIVDPGKKHKELVVSPKAIDGSAIQAVIMSLRRLDTGLFVYPAFLYFLQEEFFRVYRAKGSLSIIIFEMREVTASDGLVRRVSLSIDAVSDATMRISKCKRHTDFVAHYELSDFAIILPNTAAGGTKVFANKIIKALSEKPLAGTDGKKISFAFGAASMPEDFKDLSMLLGAAEMAMNLARQSGKSLVLFKEIEG